MMMTRVKNNENKDLRRLLAFASLILCFLILAACGDKGSQPAGQSAPFLPPTLSSGQALLTVTTVPTTPPTLGVATARVTPTLTCSNNLVFESDVTIPDGTQVAPGASLDKRWQVKNSGDCNWDAHYHFKLIDGSALGATPDQALYPARAGSEAVLRLVFTAPPDPGTYRSAWQAFGPDGQAFGDPVYIEITVTAP
jgi:hypothetical protein